MEKSQRELGIRLIDTATQFLIENGRRFTLYDLERDATLPEVVTTLRELNRPAVEWLNQGGWGNEQNT